MRQRKKKCRLLLLAYIQLCVYVLLVFNIMAFGFYRIKTIFSNERQTPLVTDNARKHSALAEAVLLLPIIITKCPYYSHHYLINLSSSNESELDKHAIESSGLIEQTHSHTYTHSDWIEANARHEFQWNSTTTITTASTTSTMHILRIVCHWTHSIVFIWLTRKTLSLGLCVVKTTIPSNR